MSLSHFCFPAVVVSVVQVFELVDVFGYLESFAFAAFVVVVVVDGCGDGDVVGGGVGEAEESFWRFHAASCAARRRSFASELYFLHLLPPSLANVASLVLIGLLLSSSLESLLSLLSLLLLELTTGTKPLFSCFFDSV